MTFETLKRTAYVAVAACSVLSLSACSNPIDIVESAMSTPTIEEARATKEGTTTAQLSDSALVKAGTLTVGIEASSSAPMCLTDASGNFEGFDIDVASALADYLGLKVEFVSVGTLADSIGTTCDIVMNTKTISASGLTIVGTYAEDATAFFHKGEATVAELSDLDGATVGVQENSSSQQYLKRSNIDAEATTYSNLNEAFEALNKGEVAYVLCDALAGSYLAEIYDGINLAGTIDVPSTIGIAASASNTEIQTVMQEALSKLNTNGVFEIMRSKWINGLDTLTTESQISGVTISSGTVASGSSESASIDGATSGVQDGSTAGANAADISSDVSSNVATNVTSN